MSCAPAPDASPRPAVLMLVWTGVSTDTRVLREAATLVAAGWRVHVVGRAVPADFRPPEGVTVSSVGAAPAAQTRGRSLSRPERLVRWLLLPEHVRRRLRRWQREALAEASRHRADVVHAHDFSALPVGAALARRWGVPLVYDSHELWSGRPRQGRPTWWRSRREARLERELGAQAAVVLTVGEGVARVLRDRCGWEDVRVVRNTFPLRPGPPPQALDRPTAPRGAVYAGRLASYRELEVVARASRTSPVPLTLLGPADVHFLRDFDPGAARVEASRDADAVDELLATAGLALVTHSDRWANHRLALPNKLFHAVRAGVPVVATDVGELALVVRQHDLGELYRPGDADALVQALHRAIDRYDELVANVHRARPALSWQADAAVLTGAFDEIRASGGLPGKVGGLPSAPREAS